MQFLNIPTDQVHVVILMAVVSPVSGWSDDDKEEKKMGKH